MTDLYGESEDAAFMEGFWFGLLISVLVAVVTVLFVWWWWLL